MKKLLQQLLAGTTPFCAIQKQDSEEILIVTGNPARFRHLSEIPRKKGKPHTGDLTYDTISVIPYAQIRERGYRAHDGGEEILTIVIDQQCKVDAMQFIDLLPEESIRLADGIHYDTTEEEYQQLVRDIVVKEIGNGEGANFVIPRKITGQLNGFSVASAMTIFKSLLQNDYGTYWKFLFYDLSRFFIGSTPERHLLVQDGRVKMNPISGTFRKDKKYLRRDDFKKDLLQFLVNEKEINELFMVVDEELKMMAKMCNRGGSIVGPLLKEMSKLIHSEYLLSGESDKDIFELFTDSMFAATVVGSPVENACNIIAKYSSESRRYYGSAMMLVGRDGEGRDFLDSPITIRTAEIDLSGNLNLAVGATLVKDSIPEEEVRETTAKGAAILSSIVEPGKRDVLPPLLMRLYNDDEIIETMVRRNQNLSNFWFFKQESKGLAGRGGRNVRVTIIHNEDDFVYMLSHMFTCMHIDTEIVRFDRYDIDHDSSDITLLGPGPGNPNDVGSTKIELNRRIAGELLARRRKSLFICLGHQILCATLGLEVARKAKPMQGEQVAIDLFGQRELVGFYNTFVPIHDARVADYDTAFLGGSRELVAVRSEHFIGYQFHPESLLTKNGYTILQDSVKHLVGRR